MLVYLYYSTNPVTHVGIGSDKRASWSPSSSLCASPLTEESYSEKLRLLEEAQHIPLERWKAPTVLAWLEVTLGMAQYGAMCAENVRSGKVCTLVIFVIKEKEKNSEGKLSNSDAEMQRDV